jgi:GTP-binding protein
VYTKIDKVSGSIREKNARLLDAGHTFHAQERVLFSAKTGQGREQLVAALERFFT